MKIKELLRALKLNKYESNAYEILLRKGLMKAGEISKEGKIPFGKIYETLEKLSDKGLVEIQNTRPKKYMIKNPKIAFKNLFYKKEKNSEEELNNFKNTLIQIEEEIERINIYEPKEKTFWVTAIGNEIEGMMQEVFREADQEVCMIPYVVDKEMQIKSALSNISKVLKEIKKLSKKGVKIRVIFPEKFAKSQVKIFKKMKIFEKVKENLEIRILKDLSFEPFTIIDTSKIILRINDPLDKNKILAMTKISDKKLSKDLKNKFDEMWKIARLIK